MASQAVLELLVQLKDEASGGLGRIGGILGNVGSAALTVAGGGLLAIGGAMAGATAAGLSFNSSMEIVTAQLNAFTKDGAKSAAILEMIKTRASQTPFEFEAMAQAATSLLPAANASGVALEDLIAKAEILAASNPAEGLEGAAFALKEAVSGDFTSVIERFNLPRQRLNELKEEGVPALQAVQIAMQELGLDADLVTNLAGTMTGRWSTFKDTLMGLAATASAPIFDLLSSGLAKVNDWITANQPMIDAFAATLANDITNGIDFVSDAITDLIALFSGGEIFEDSPIAQIAPHLRTAIEVIDTARDAVTDFFAVLQGGEIFEDSPIAAYADAIRGLMDVFNEGGTGVELFNQILAGLQSRWEAVMAAINEVLPPLQDMVIEVFGVIAEFLDAHGAEILETLTTVWQQINTIINTVVEIIGVVVAAAFGGIAQFIRTHSTEIQLVLSAAWEIIKNLITGALALIQGVVQTALALLRGDWQGAWAAIQQMSATFVQALGGVIKGGLDLIAGFFGTSIDKIIALWRGLGNQAVSLGRNIIDGIIAGVSAAAGSLYDMLSGIASDALQVAKDALGISSPSKEFAEGVGRPIMQGIILGVNGMLPSLESVFTQVASSLLAKAKKVTDAVRNQVAKVVEDLQKQAKSIGQQINDAIASGFSSEASIDRLLADNLDAIRDFTGKLGMQVRQDLDEALRASSRIADPAQAAEFYRMRSDQILELADLQAQLNTDLAKEDRARLEAQLALIQAAQLAEQKAFAASGAGKASPQQQLIEQLQALLGNSVLPGILDNPIIAQLTTMLQQLQNGAGSFVTPSSPFANSGPVSNRPEAPTVINNTFNLPAGTSKQLADEVIRRLSAQTSARRTA